MSSTSTAAVDDKPEGGRAAVANSAQAQADSLGSRWSLKHWRLRSKLAVVLIIPTLTALGLGGLRAANEFGLAADFGDTVSQVDLASAVAATAHELQGERTLAVATIASPAGADRAALGDQVAKVDRAVAALRAAAEQIGADSDESARYQRGLQRLNALGPLRAAANNPSYPDLSAYNTYTSILESINQLSNEVTTTVTDRDLLREGNTIFSLSQAKEYVARENAALQIAAGRDEFPGDLLEEVRAAQASSRAAIGNFNSDATPAERQLYSDTVSGAEVDDRERIKASAFVLADADQPLNIAVARLTPDGTATVSRMRDVEIKLLAGMRAHADDLAGVATTTAWLFTAGVVAAVVAALILMLLVARSLLVPLRTLRTNALDVAYTKLPSTIQRILQNPDPLKAAREAVEPVPVLTREEIGEVARSFDAVHAQAVKLAAEQALLRENVNGMFVNLSRRSQRLVERQLGVIDRLEADEQDPDHLASLFELDHLATRLRRNGESLLVLSGAGLTKAMARPVPAVEVIGAAVSEIEQYARVEVGAVPEISVQGRAIQDLVHLLAELLDNATYFSEPETKVTLRAAVTRKRALAIQVTDKGVGMSEEDIEEANLRLADPPDFDVAVTRRMGLYVVARLAKRHGIEVRLRDNEEIDNGIIARIVVPAELLVATPAPQSLGGPPSQPRMPANPAPSAQVAALPSFSPTFAPSAEPFRPVEQFEPLRVEPRERPTPPPAEPEPMAAPAEAPAANGLVALDQPISLDDLVAGSTSAAFLSSPDSSAAPAPALPSPRTLPTPPPAPPAEEYDFGFPTEEPDGPPHNGHGDQQDEQHGSAVNGAQNGSGNPPTDDAPTRRLPIYQSVMSRWFSEEAGEDGEPKAESPNAESPNAESPNEESTKNVAPAEAAAAEPAETPAPEPEPKFVEGVPPRPRQPVAASWHSASDSGWQAAQALLEPHNDDVTTAGLPKRVPNAYLVPGSVRTSEPDAFRDTTAGQPSPSAISRSAAAARSRMVSFQRGYQTGRHALQDGDPAAGVGAFGSDQGAGNNAGQGTREWQ